MRLQGQAKCDIKSDALKDKLINWIDQMDYQTEIRLSVDDDENGQKN